MFGQPTTDSQKQQHSRHEKLYSHRPDVKRGAERRRQQVGKEAKVNFLRKHYREEFGLSESDLMFIACLAHLEVNGVVHLQDEHGEPTSREYYLTEGHRWVVERFDPDIGLLREVGLIQNPHINGEPRERIIRRRFWDLTVSGRDLVNVDYSGNNIGDPGEHVVHRIGLHMVNWWAEERWGWASHMIPERYPSIEGAEMDFVVWHSPENQTIDGVDVDRRTAHLFEVETGMSDWSSLASDAHKMAYLGGKSWWVFPTREVLVSVLDELSMRGYTGLESVPETLPIRDFRDTYNKRLERAERELTELNHPPVERVVTFKNLADDLRDSRPELFYGPKDSR